jgi:Beta-lactamase
MFAPHYQPDPRLPGVGLGFFRRDLGGHPVVQHDGLVPGFTSLMSLAPDDRIGVVAFTNGSRGAIAWLGSEVAAILRSILGVSEPVIRADVPHRPQIWTDVCGWYTFRGSLRDAQKWFVAGAQVRVKRGQLVLRPVTPVPAVLRDLPLHPDDPDDPYVFRIDLSGLGIGTSRLVFSRSPSAGVTAFHLDLDLAPLSFDKRPARAGGRGR